MNRELIYINKDSEIPLMGVDFLGVIDRGTNIIELKPLTLCNLKCKYCFVSANDYETNFMINSDYLVENVKKVVEIKGEFDIEIHIAPYGEILLYPELNNLLERFSNMNGITTISMQSNGLLLSPDLVKMLKIKGLTRINLSLNTLNEELACYLCNCNEYDLDMIIKNIYNLLDSKIDILLAPVWFPGQNDTDIEDIIKLILNLRKEGFTEQQTQIGIQKYLIYKTGRKLKKIRPKSWDYFYSQLTKLEKKYNIKLKLGPNDFGIHKRTSVSSLKYQKGDLLKIKIISRGRWQNECIGKIDDNVGIKILLKKPLIFDDGLVGTSVTAKIIKANYKDNITTALYPF
ncbi:MAG: radical SAM protein [Candidatus Lokiarchaeota archaeon]|nr:radical SAM protein [Candidatus Lokiarchaeota archaeon]